MTVKQISRNWLMLDAVVIAFWLGAVFADWAVTHPKQEPPFWITAIGLCFGLASVFALVDVFGRVGRFLWAAQREGAEDWGSVK